MSTLQFLGVWAVIVLSILIGYTLGVARGKTQD